jgi:hypothetical protein
VHCSGICCFAPTLLSLPPQDQAKHPRSPCGATRAIFGEKGLDAIHDPIQEHALTHALQRDEWPWAASSPIISKVSCPGTSLCSICSFWSA